ncbi:hypothetical protein BDW68DRAFT_179546 [Aspergillus falconensis]
MSMHRPVLFARRTCRIMWLVYLFLPIGLLLPKTVHGHAQQESPDVPKDVEALGDLKHLVALASSVASLIEDKDASSGNSQSAFDSDREIALHKGALLPGDDGAIIASDSSTRLDSQSDDECVADEPVNMPTSMVCAGADADANGLRDIVQQFALTLEGTISRLDVDGQGRSSVAERSPGLYCSVSGRKGAGSGSSQFGKGPHASAPAPVRVSGVDTLGDLEALRHLASLVQSEYMGNTRYRPPGASEPPVPPVAGKKLRSISTAEPTLRQPPSRKRTQPPAQPDILTRLEAMRRFSKLAKKLSILTDESGPLSLRERIHNLISDPELATTVRWIFDNAEKVLTPEVLSAVKSFVHSSPLIPDEYRSFALFVADSLGPVFDPKFATHYRKVKASVEWLDVGLVPVLGSVSRGMHWIMATFHPANIQTLNNRVTLWRKAFASPEMAGFLDVATDPATLDAISSAMARVKQTLTGERIHRLRTVFDEWGVSDLNKDEYDAFGDVLGTKIKRQLATAEGISEIENFLDAMDSLLQGQTIHTLGDIMQKRAAVLAADLAEDLRSFFDEVSSAVATVPGVLGVLRDFLDLIRPLLDSGFRDAWLPARVWAVAGFIIDKLSSVQGSALADWQGVLDAGLRFVRPERVEQLRVVITELQLGDTLSEFLVPVGANAGRNASVGPETFFEFSSGMLHTHPTPVLEPDATGERLSMLIQMLDTRLAPAEIERTRETLQLLKSTSSFLLSVLGVFESQPDSPKLVTGGHEEL